MEFSWGFIALFFVIFWGTGRLCGWGPRRRWRTREPEQMSNSDADDTRLSNLEERVKQLGRGRNRGRLTEATYGEAGGREREPARLQSRPSRLEELQKRFVEGRLSMDEYERELDRLEKIE